MSNHNYPIKPSLINAWSARLAEQVPFCPCPPETLDCAVKSELSKVDGGILFPVSVSHEAHLVAFNNHHASNCYCPCNECQLLNDSVSRSYSKNNKDKSLRFESYPVNGCLQLSNLE